VTTLQTAPAGEGIGIGRREAGRLGLRLPRSTPEAYKRRHAVECGINQQHRGLATRFDKLAVRCEATIHVTAMNIWLRCLERRYETPPNGPERSGQRTERAQQGRQQRRPQQPEARSRRRLQPAGGTCAPDHSGKTSDSTPSLQRRTDAQNQVGEVGDLRHVTVSPSGPADRGSKSRSGHRGPCPHGAHMVPTCLVPG
jgi:hypothetical protein